jgi:hypothetical protein
MIELSLKEGLKIVKKTQQRVLIHIEDRDTGESQKINPNGR